MIHLMHNSYKFSLFVLIGIYYTMAVIGPAVGYLIGGQFLKLYVDIGVDPTE